jgi:MinD-like ATPase involved in chromosome partitioning or flagellar assembly
MIAVVGPGGTGVTTLALGLGRELALLRPTLVADLARNGGLSCHLGLDPNRHGLPEVLAGAWPPPSVPVARGLHVLTGLRDPADWTTVPDDGAVPAALTALAVDRTVVCDLGADLEGQRHTGSLDVEDRHRLARSAAQRAHVVVLVTTPGDGALRSCAQLARELCELAVDGRRLVIVLNRARRGPNAAAWQRAITTHLWATTGILLATPAVPVPQRRPLRVDRPGRTTPLAPRAARRVLAAVLRQASQLDPPPVPPLGTPIVPGELGFA